MPRFVILEHDHPYPHFDLMLEAGPVLWTWRLAALPTELPVEATRVADHRLIYLTYEGPVSGGRGSVRRVDQGEFTWRTSDPDRLSLILSGGSLQGMLSLEGQGGDLWRVSCRTDQES
jgi:hypothetical protein